ncbi:exopolygalacturonase B [Aspergillus karnatakaensis]|uniref:exopolygalacturonase B n=1 Tax=Aspergillus karnatakaensis TaxID=1810916 RepID=UPI003CCD8475
MLISAALPILLLSHLGLCAATALTNRQESSPRSYDHDHGQGKRSLKKCVVKAQNDGTDDAPAIRQAFDICGHNGNVIFENTTYHINSPLTTTDLFDCRVDIFGTLLWSNDTSYWLNNSMPVGYQNQSTVWFLGGEGLSVYGHGYGTFDGNGQAWYDLVKGESNYPNRPMALAIWGAKDSVFKGLRFVQAQMWTATIMHSSNLLLEDIYVNNTSRNRNPARNTDGANTIYSDNITFRRWQVYNGDDAIALKANSTNILVENLVSHDGNGFSLGSIGQYKGEVETIENVTVRDVVFENTKYATRIKTWTGEQVGYPPNGGGGGLGYLSNFTATNIRETPIFFTQCITYNGVTGNCSSSPFKISDFTATNYRGTSQSSYIGRLQCSRAAGGCDGIRIEDIELLNTAVEPPIQASRWSCSNVVEPVGFAC